MNETFWCVRGDYSEIIQGGGGGGGVKLRHQNEVTRRLPEAAWRSRSQCKAFDGGFYVVHETLRVSNYATYFNRPPPTAAVTYPATCLLFAMFACLFTFTTLAYLSNYQFCLLLIFTKLYITWRITFILFITNK